MRFSALGRGIADGDFEDVGGGVFRSGASSSLRREGGPETFPTVASTDAPPLALKAPDVDLPWAGSVTMPLQMGNRQWTRNAQRHCCRRLPRSEAIKFQ